MGCSRRVEDSGLLFGCLKGCSVLVVTRARSRDGGIE